MAPRHFINIAFTRSISPRSVQLSPMGSELGSGLLADQSESRKFLCPNMERLCAALKSAAKIRAVLRENLQLSFKALR